MSTRILYPPEHTPANYIRQMNAFLDLVEHDERLRLCHVGLYLALFRCWNNAFFNNPFYVSRAKLMKAGHIGSQNTFARVIRELESFGYINYFPPGKKGSASMVSVIPIMPMPKPKKVIPAGIADDTGQTAENVPVSAENGQNMEGDDTSPVSPVIPINKQIKHINKKNKNMLSQNNLPVKKFEPPSREEVIVAFRSWGMPETDATLFFLHYQANGWYQSGKVAIRDWKAAAEKWILNTQKFKSKENANKPGNLNAAACNYAEPI